jgi:hypothetical protein
MRHSRTLGTTEYTGISPCSGTEEVD